MMHLLQGYMTLFGAGIVGAITMAVSFSIIIKVWSLITPIDDWEEIKKGNIAAAIVTAAVILGGAIVICSAIR